VYRADVETEVPDPDDIVASARRSVREIDLTDERSIVAVVRDAVSHPDFLAAGSPDSRMASTEDGITVRAVLSRLGAVIDGL
jgi:hypothetical protein